MPEEQSTATEASQVLKTFSLEECKKHTTEQSCWLVIHGKVYDVTEFLEEHPGGYDIVVSSAGELGYKVDAHASAARADTSDKCIKLKTAAPVLVAQACKPRARSPSQCARVLSCESKAPTLEL